MQLSGTDSACASVPRQEPSHFNVRAAENGVIVEDFTDGGYPPRVKVFKTREEVIGFVSEWLEKESAKG